MKIKQRKSLLFFAFCASLALHLAILGLYGPNYFETKTAETPHQFKIDSIRSVGEDNDNAKNTVFIPKQVKTEDASSKEQAAKGKQINLSDLQAQMPGQNLQAQATQNKRVENRPSEKKAKPIDALSLNRESVRSFMRDTHNAGSSGEYARAFGKSNVLVDLEVPDGVAEDELNKYELMFYSFRKRTALNYVNSFYNELVDFESANPHLRFPMTDQREQMTGRITYDKDGNIVRIKMLRWTEKEKLQEFFLQVLKNMNSLPNPPEVIIKDGEFHVYYSLTVEG